MDNVREADQKIGKAGGGINFVQANPRTFLIRTISCWHFSLTYRTLDNIQDLRIAVSVSTPRKNCVQRF